VAQQDIDHRPSDELMKTWVSTRQEKPSPPEWSQRVPYLSQGHYPFAEEEKDAFHWIPPFHWYENDSHFCLEWNLEGLSPDHLEFMVQKRTLIIKEKTTSSHLFDGNQKRPDSPPFIQRVRLPKHIQAQKGEADYQCGKLTISFPKSSQEFGDKIKSTWLSLAQTLSTKSKGLPLSFS